MVRSQKRSLTGLNDALEKSSSGVSAVASCVILVSPAVVQGAPDDLQHPGTHYVPAGWRTVMIRLKGCLSSLSLLSPLTQAADLGTGDLWSVREQDMLRFITQRLQSRNPRPVGPDDGCA